MLSKVSGVKKSMDETIINEREGIMAVLSIEELELEERRVFVRVDFNCPVKDGVVTDDTRIRKALPTIEYLLKKNAKVVLASHLGRPKGRYVKEMSLEPVAVRLSELLGKDVILTDDCVGDGPKKIVMDLRPGHVALLENLRFHKEETDNDEHFSKKLSQLADIYVNDAFGTAHRAHASTHGIAQFIQTKAAGFLMLKEIEYLGKALEAPEKPFIAILGGAKVSDKIGVIENLLDKVDAMIIGGGMAYTFLLAKGVNVGNSLLEKDRIETAKKIIKGAKARKVELLLPVDHIIADKLEEGAQATKTEGEEIPEGKMALDIGLKTQKLFKAKIEIAQTIIWNGPMGVFEFDQFAEGTIALAKAVAQSPAISIVGGGDSVSAINKAGVADDITHISTGGGASLKMMEGKVLPGLAALES